MYSSVRAGLELSVSELRPLRVQDIIHSHSLGQETSRDEGESVMSNLTVSVSMMMLYLIAFAFSLTAITYRCESEYIPYTDTDTDY